MKNRLSARRIIPAMLSSLIMVSGISATVSASSLEIASEEHSEDNMDNLFDVFGSIELTPTQDAPSEFSYATVADVAEACLPSIVSITNISVQQVRDYFFMRSYQYESESAGTGIIVGQNDSELLICTNHHVVDDAHQITVTFIDDESVSGQLKGTDATNDLAVVAVALSDIPKDTFDQIKIARTGSSDSMRIGEQVVAIGNALGYGQSVTTGIISALDRSLSVSDNGYSVSGTYENLIQTDAAINAGNSGGALLNMSGEVIGINSAKASRSGVEGMGYAIPISKAMPILEELMTQKTRMRLTEEEMGYLGVNGQSVSSQAARLYDIPLGIYITYVGDGTPAQTAGLKEGDILASFDGEPLRSMSDLQNILVYYPAGEIVELLVYTNVDGTYQEKVFYATLGDRRDIR